MEIIRIVLTVIWLIIGLANLIGKESVDRWSYGCCWVLLMFFMIEHCIEGVV